MLKRLLILLILLTGCRQQVSTTISAEKLMETKATPTELNWWHEGIIYQIFVRSFRDSDGNGIGDLNGVTEKLDYLAELGATILWLMPISEAVSYHGYDVTDYHKIEQDYGTSADFERLLDEAHKRGIRIIVDLVLNHTSVEHEWFQASRDPQSEYRDWYVWADEPGKIGWHEDQSGYYYGIFDSGMPDLNYRNPKVTAMAEEVSRFWLEEIKVDGFRLDAVKHWIEEGDILENAPETFVWFRDYYKKMKAIKPDALLLGEVWSPGSISAEYVTTQALDLTFEFELAKGIISGARGNPKAPAMLYERAIKNYAPYHFVSFIANHDQIRVMSQLFGEPARAPLAATILLTSPGIPVIYYGEEIGLEGTKPDELIRRPMPWSAESNGGFTTGEPWQALGEGWEVGNVATQSADPTSLLNHYKTLVALRQKWPALRTGSWLPVEAGQKALYSYLRVEKDHAILALLNLGKEVVADYQLTLETSELSADWRATALLGEQPTPITIDENGGFSYNPFAELQPFSTQLILLEK